MSKVLRAGMGRARNETAVNSLPEIVKELARSKIYLAQIASQSFPRTLSELQDRTRLEQSSPDREFVWCAAVLGLFKQQIADFVKIKLAFEQAFLKAEWGVAESLLTEVESKFGVSIWLLVHRLRVLQQAHGLKAQKDFLEKTISVGGLNRFAAWITYYSSLRSEESTSYASLQIQLDDFRSDSAVNDYVIYHIVPYELTSLQNPSQVLNWEEALPIVDRYQSFVSMSMLQLANEGLARSPWLKLALKLLQDIDDPRLIRMQMLVNDCINAGVLSRHLVACFDSYTEGRYLDIGFDLFECPELVARTAVMLETISPESEKSIFSEVVQAMTKVISLSPDYQKSIDRLKKLALICSGLPISTQIAAFLERTHDQIFVGELSELDRLGALDSPIENPWSANALSQVAGSAQAIHALFNQTYASTAYGLIHALNLGEREGLAAIASINLPEYRAAMYRGHLYFRGKNFQLAAQQYGDALSARSSHVKARASSYLFLALFEQGKLLDSVMLFVRHFFENPGAWELYPVEQLANACLQEDIEPSCELAIVFHVASIHIHPNWERELSDVYESILNNLGVSKPTQIFSKYATSNPILIYFLRYVCTPRVLEDTTAFATVSEIENERIAVCQRLIDWDPSSADSYALEIRSITRSANIAQRLEQVEASKIYVDEAGVRGAAHEQLAVAYSRYQQLLRNPELGYQAEKISNLVGSLVENLLGENTPSGLKNLKLPGSDQEALLESMLSQFIWQFAANPAYGFDTHLSTTIRHGAFEGHTRGPLTSEGLLSQRSTVNGEWVLPPRWEREFEHFSAQEKDFLRLQLGKFTERIEEQIGRWLKELLKIRGLDNNTNGLFVFEESAGDLRELGALIGEQTTYAEFADKLLGLSWQLADRSMASIREHLQGEFLGQVNGAFDSLIRAVSTRFESARVVAVVDACVRARTNFQTAVDGICGWFQRPTDLLRDPFDFDLAVDVALKQVENCYVNSPISLRRHLQPIGKFEGELFDSFVEVLFILFQNVIRHSGYDGSPEGVHLSLESYEHAIEIKISNQLAPGVDIEARRENAVEAMQKYEKDTAMKMARLEGGSGLSKVWRILEFDVRRPHTLVLDIAPGGQFNVILRIDDIPRFE